MFCFVHSSDWHLPFPLENLVGHWRLKQKLGRISYRRHRRLQHTQEVVDAAMDCWCSLKPDRFCVTGDLVNFALPAEFEAAAKCLKRLEECGPVTLVPGNHDALVRSGLDNQVKHWGHNLAPDGEVKWPSVIRQGPVAFIGLSSSLPTPPFIAQGVVEQRQLDALDQLLPKLAEEGLFRVVMLHHPPQKDAISWRGALRKAKALRAVFRRHGAELILHGHLHHPVQAALEGPQGPIPVLGVGSASSARMQGRAERGHFRYFALEPGSSGGLRLLLTDYFFDGSKGTFLPEPTREIETPASKTRASS